MIKINTKNINEWEYIVQSHEEYFKKYVIPKFTCEEVISHELYSYFEDIINELKEMGVNLASARLNEFFNIMNEYDLKLESMLSNLESKKGKEERTKDINRFFKLIFNYDSFCNNQNKLKNENWNRHRLITLMEVPVCPYCNRIYITSYIENDNERQTTADLDHFYLKSKYPFLSLSLYNFIPSCQICNSRFKGNKFDAKNHIYPYDEEFGDNAKFIIESENIDYILTGNIDFKIKLDCNGETILDKKIKNSIETFKLEKVYQIHKDHVKNILINAKILNKDRIEDLMQSLPEMFNDEKNLREVLMNTHFEDKDLCKKPLTKLTKDICMQYGINNDEGWFFSYLSISD